MVNKTDKKDIVSGVLTGDVVADIGLGKGILLRVWDWILDFSISGNVILEKELELEGEISETIENKIVDVENIVNETDAEEVAVEYWTPAPVAVEIDFSGGKLVTISADDVYNYTDILVYSLIERMGVSVNESLKLNVYWRASYEDAVKYGYIEESVEQGDKNNGVDLEKIKESKKKIPSVASG